MTDTLKSWFSIPDVPSTANGLTVTILSGGALKVDVGTLLKTEEARRQISALSDIESESEEPISQETE